MRQKMKFYQNKIRMRYQTCDGEKAYTYNRGYIMGLSDSQVIKTSEGYELIDLNVLLRRKK